jgi:DNA-binding LacI/PurR family transcriptional regulator
LLYFGCKRLQKYELIKLYRIDTVPVSIKDIAKEAGVSPSTVSRALNDHPHVNDKTKEYIRNIAKAMGYVPSILARSLVSKRSATIGVAMTDLVDPYYGPLMLGIEDAAKAQNFQVMISSFYRSAERELDIVHDFHMRRMDGIIITGSEVEEAYGSTDQRFFMPIVLVNRPNFLFSVSVDRCLGAQKVVGHLIELGHRRIAHISEGSQYQPKSRRLKGYRTALEKHGIPFNETLIVDGDGGISGGIKAVPPLLDLPERPTAIFCFNDMTAIGVINALRQRGYEVPRDFSVAGYDDLEMAAYYFPALTTVRQQTYQLGKQAVEMLLELIKGVDGTASQMVEPELVIRESTASISNFGG